MPNSICRLTESFDAVLCCVSIDYLVRPSR
jgi:hypothetical protein